MVWFDYCVVKLSTLFESLSSIGITRKTDIFLCLYINTGTINVSVSAPGLTTLGYSPTTSNNSFNATCPFTVNYLNDVPANGGIPLTTANISAGLHIAKIPATTYNGVNLCNAGASQPLSACRIYYSQITLRPAYEEEYILTNRAKKCFSNHYN